MHQMMRDATSDPQDAVVIGGTSMRDVDVETFKGYRNRFASRNPDHPFLALGGKEFLQKIGGWKQDRATSKKDGLTLAGALMFGTMEAVRGAAENLHLDYLERYSLEPDNRYDDRFTSDDGAWVPNLYNFYFKVYPRLVEGLKTPFALGDDAMRKGETPFHRAVREATVNAIVHADFRSRGSIRISKRPDAFIFQNPGRSLIAIDRIVEARHAGEDLTEVRNPNILRMFSLIGLAERLGSGYPTIFSAWDGGHRHSPRIDEDLERNLSTFTLPLLSQISPEAERELLRTVGAEYALLSALDKDILLQAYQFGETSNEAIRFGRKEHPREIGHRLRFLADKGWLSRKGTSGRGRTYSFAVPPHHVEEDPHHVVGGSAIQDADLLGIAAGIRNKPKPSKAEIEATVLALCDGRFLTVRQLAELLGRAHSSLRDRYLAPMVADGRLIRRNPESAGHPSQAYRKAAT